MLGRKALPNLPGYEDRLFVAQLIFIDQSVTQAVEQHKVSEKFQYAILGDAL